MRRPGRAGSDYGGAGRFWDGVEKLKAARIYGIAMIAPESQAACCEAGKPQRALRADPRPARRRAVRRRALSAAAMGRHARRRGRHRLHRRLDRRWLPDDDPRHTIDLGTLEAKGGKVAHLKLADVAEFGVETGAQRYAYREGEPRQRQQSRLPGEPQLERLREAFRDIYDLDERDRGPAQLQQPGADPSEPLPAWLGALPALASRLSLRVRAEPAGLRAATHAPLLGLDDAAVSAGRADKRLHHSAGLQGLPDGGGGRRLIGELDPAPSRRRPMHSARMAEPTGRYCSSRSTTSSAT